MPREEFITDCTLCYHSCGCVVEVEDGVAKRIRGFGSHPLSRGKLCPKGASALDIIYSRERLKRPLKRNGGGFSEISWEQALDEISERILGIMDDHGPESIAFFCGSVGVENYEMFTLTHLLQSSLGTPNFFSVESVCYRMRILVRQVTFGRYLVEDMDSNLYVLWGHNPDASDFPLARRIRENLKKGSELVVIDPRRIPLADHAKMHLRVRPGTDLALGLAVLNVIVSEGLCDREFVEKHTEGFDRLKREVEVYTPEWAEGITGVSKEDIVRFSRLYAGVKGASIHQGICTQDQQEQGVQTNRVFSILQAITGNINIKGGWVSVPFPRLNYPSVETGKLPIGQDRFRFFGKRLPFGVASLIPSSIPNPIKAFIVIGGNPLITMPDSKAFRSSFEKLDLLVVHDLFLTETARMAHYVLPASSHLEKWGIAYTYSVCHGIPYLLLRKKCIDPLYDSWSEWRFITELSKRLGVGDRFPWGSEEEYVDFLLKPTGFSFDYLLNEKPEGVFFAEKRYGEMSFRTPSGKIELFSRVFEECGLDPIPRFSGLDGHVGGLVMSVGVRNIYYTHSQHRQSPRLKRMAPGPVLEISKKTAQDKGIGDGDLVEIRTSWGRARFRAKVSDVMDGVVLVPHGWEGESNGNLLTTVEQLEPVMGYPIFKGLSCDICKVKES